MQQIYIGLFASEKEKGFLQTIKLRSKFFHSIGEPYNLPAIKTRKSVFNYLLRGLCIIFLVEVAYQ